MKRIAVFVILLIAPVLDAELESEIPLGLEAVTGVRSGYVFRGFDLADTLFDFQLEGEVALNDQLLLNVGGWLATESGADFEEFAGFIDLRQNFSDLLTAGLAATYHTYSNSLFDDGIDLGTFITLYATEELDFTFGVYHDFGAEGWYANAETGWSTRLGEGSYFALQGGLSWVDGYYDRSGMNDFYGRASVTHNVNSAVSLTPFVGWSLEIEDEAGDGDEFFGGLWFEVVF